MNNGAQEPLLSLSRKLTCLLLHLTDDDFCLSREFRHLLSFFFFFFWQAPMGRGQPRKHLSGGFHSAAAVGFAGGTPHPPLVCVWKFGPPPLISLPPLFPFLSLPHPPSFGFTPSALPLSPPHRDRSLSLSLTSLKFRPSHESHISRKPWLL